MLGKTNAQERIKLILLTLNERIYNVEKIFNWSAKCSFLQIQQTRSLRLSFQIQYSSNTKMEFDV